MRWRKVIIFVLNLYLRTVGVNERSKLRQHTHNVLGWYIEDPISGGYI